MITSALVPLMILTCLPQDPAGTQQGEVQWKYGVTPPNGAVAVVDDAVVTMELFLDEMSSHFARPDQPLGRETLNNLVDEILVATEASRRGFQVSDSDVEKETSELEEQLKKSGTSLAAELDKKQVPRAAFQAKLRKTLLLKQLAREDQRIPAPAAVSATHMSVWLKNRRAAAKIEMDRAKLPKGTVANIDGTPLDERTFVAAVLPDANRKDVRDKVEMLMQYVLMMRALEQNQLSLTEADVELEYVDKRRVFESNPQMKGIEYAAFVKERTGLDTDALKQSRAFRLHAAVSKIGRKQFTPADVQAYYDKNIEYFGPRYSVRHLLIRGADNESKDLDGRVLIPTKAKAREQIASIQKELAKGKRFEDLVQIYSEHTPTKFKGGVLDPFTPKTAPYDSFGEAVKPLKVNDISQPVETPLGFHLLKVEGIQPAPPVQAVESTIRQELGTNYLRELYQKARKGADIRVE